MFQVTGSVSRGSTLEYWIRDRYTSKFIWKFYLLSSVSGSGPESSGFESWDPDSWRYISNFDFSLPGFWFRIRTRVKWVRILDSGSVTGTILNFSVFSYLLDSNFRIRIRFKWIRILNPDPWRYFFLTFRFVPGIQDYRDPDLFQEDSDSGSGSAKGTYGF